MSSIHRSRLAERLLTLFVLVGVTSFAWARVRTAESRTLPYQGVLERDGAPISGAVTARFGLFNAPNAITACVATNSCPLWSDEVSITVVDGRFSVLLGEGAEPLTSSILSSPQLFLGVAFKTDGDAAFTALSGTQEIIGAPVLQAGAVAPNTFFSAVVDSVSGPNPNSSPPGWIGPGTVAQGASRITFPLNTGGATRLTCTASPVGGNPLWVNVLSATPTELVIVILANSGTNIFTAVDRFSIICVGF